MFELNSLKIAKIYQGDCSAAKNAYISLGGGIQKATSHSPLPAKP